MKRSTYISDDDWGAIKSIRDDWPDAVNWDRLRDELDGQGRFYWRQREGLQRFGMPSAVMKTLKVVGGHLSKAQRASRDLPEHVSTPVLAKLTELDEYLKNWSGIYEYKADAFAAGFGGRNDFHREMLLEALLTEWVDTLGGTLSFSRDRNEQPYGPPIEFLSITLKAILGKAPGPSGIAKIIDQYR